MNRRERSLTRSARLALAVLVVAVSCAHPRSGPGGIEGRPPSGGRPGAIGPETGLASFYARSLEGGRTANGERYTGREMTAAHRFHAFGTMLRVTDLATGRSVVVRVTDRGPFVAGRVLDLSRAAAQKLGIVDRGVARVRVEPLNEEEVRRE